MKKLFVVGIMAFSLMSFTTLEEKTVNSIAITKIEFNFDKCIERVCSTDPTTGENTCGPWYETDCSEWEEVKKIAE